MLPSYAQQWRTWLPWAMCFVAVVGAELAIGAGWVQAGVVLLLLMAGALLVYTVALTARGGIAAFTGRVFALTLTLVPLLRVASLGLPLERLPPSVWSLAVWAPTVAAAVVMLRHLDLAPSAINLVPDRAPAQLLFGLIGLPVGGVAYLLLPAQPLAVDPSSRRSLLVGISVLFITGVLDEVMFRGLLNETARAVFGRSGIFYVSGLYAALQLETRSPGAVLVALGIALGASWWVERTRSVLGVAVAHGLANVGVYLLLPVFAANGYRF